MITHRRGESGSPVLCLHSGGFSSRQWKRLADLLEPTHRVLLPDLIGYGASSPLPPGSPWNYRDDLPPLFELLTEPMHLVGHSYGGLLALQHALALPDRVLSLSLYEPVAFGILAADDKAGAFEARDYDGEPWLEGFVDWWQGAGAWSHMAAEARAAFVAVGWKVYREVVTLVVDATDRATYATIAAPTLIMTGGQSPEIEQRVCRALQAVLPHATLETFATLGHMGPITNAKEVNARIAAHLG